MERLIREVGNTRGVKGVFKTNAARTGFPMLTSGMTAAKKDAIDTMETMLYIADIFMVGEMQRYVAMVKSYCKDNGLYKQITKKRVNAMMEMMSQRQQHLAQYEHDVLYRTITAGFPEYKDDFHQDGGSISKQLQSDMNASTNDGFYRIFEAYSVLFQEQGVAHSELVAIMYTIEEMASMGRNVATSIVRNMELIGTGISTSRNISIGMFDKVSVCGREVLSSLGINGSVTIDREKLYDVQRIFDDIQSILVKGDLCIRFLRTVGQMSAAYVDYCIAKLALTIKHELRIMGKPGIRLQKMLGPIGVSALTVQLNAYDIPDDAGVWDVVDIIGVYKEGSALWRFAQECYKELHFLHALAKIDEEKSDVNNMEKNALN